MEQQDDIVILDKRVNVILAKPIFKVYFIWSLKFFLSILSHQSFKFSVKKGNITKMKGSPGHIGELVAMWHFGQLNSSTWHFLVDHINHLFIEK